MREAGGYVETQLIPAAGLRDRALEIMEQSGQPWYVAVRRASEELGAGAPSWLVGSGGGGNWTWYADFSRGDAAVDIRGGVGDTAAALLGYFKEVVLIEPDPAWHRFLKRRFPSSMIRQPQIIFGGVERLRDLNRKVAFISITFAESIPSEATRLALHACHDALLPGGQIRVAPDWDSLQGTPRNLVLGRARALHHWRLLLKNTGFHGTRGFYVDPSHHDPRLIIPMTRHATLAVERHNLRGSATGTLRRTLAWSGVHWPLYQQCFFLAAR